LDDVLVWAAPFWVDFASIDELRLSFGR